MFSGGWLFASVILLIYIMAGVFPGNWISYFPAITLIALGGTLVESLPIKDVDNITVTLSAVLLGHILL
jgi:phosphatidylserine synthase